MNKILGRLREIKLYETLKSEVTESQVISSQKYLDEVIVKKYVEQFKKDKMKSITLKVAYLGLKGDSGREVFLLSDGNHRYVAAKRLKLSILFEVVGRELITDIYTGVDLLIKDSMTQTDKYCYISSGKPVWKDFECLINNEDKFSVR